MFNSLFGNKGDKADKTSMWKLLTDKQQLEGIRQQSSDKPVVIFKHSTRCSISRMTLRQFEHEFSMQDKTELYFLDLLNYRGVSDEISTIFGVRHQSPQVLLIRNGEVVYHDSHGEIDAAKLEGLLV